MTNRYYSVKILMFNGLVVISGYCGGSFMNISNDNILLK